ncbi:hypothetical protein ACFWPU_15070 [Streptomyces sp. NPDC058471]|uniref:hypothetical protein n=1 Tax=Streptomyces sp. NPDC058471 TaxID=3346516 RepID=UPI00365D704B
MLKNVRPFVSGMRTEEFLTGLDDEMLEYFREMAEVLVDRFGITRAEAVARINERYAGKVIEGMAQDLMGHEMPEFWAYGIYFLPDEEGRQPSGDENEDVDLSAFEIRPAPPKDSAAWTVPSDD